MREVFQQELREVQDRLVEISELVATSIDKATRAFNESDVTLAEECIEDDARIDELAVALDELAITILARQQPVARDLRIVVSALRISASLERMGDLADAHRPAGPLPLPRQGRAEEPAPDLRRDGPARRGDRPASSPSC